jgi:hypothetical protein
MRTIFGSLVVLLVLVVLAALFFFSSLYNIAAVRSHSPATS